MKVRSKDCLCNIEVIMAKCDRCLIEFDKLEKVTYHVQCADGVLEVPADYCTECANINERIHKEENEKQS